MDFLEFLLTFKFLNAKVVNGIDEFVTQIDKTTVANNVILICLEQMSSSIQVKLNEKNTRKSKIIGIIK